jgi:hypothetical protein
LPPSPRPWRERITGQRSAYRQQGKESSSSAASDVTDLAARDSDCRESARPPAVGRQANELAARIDLNALLTRVDVDAVVKKVDLNTLLDQVDVNAFLGQSTAVS